MKFDRVFVDEPYNRGLWHRPVLTFFMPEPLHETSGVQTFKPTGVVWTTQKFGPFISYTCDLEARQRAGHYNVAYRDLADPIVDVMPMYRDGRVYVRQSGNFGLTVKRARQFIRQYEIPWRLLLNDHDAQHGLVSWTPVPKNPVCSPGLLLGRNCERPAIQAVYERGLDVPLCALHLNNFNNTRKAARQARQGA